MSDLQDELEREIIYDHYERPRKKGIVDENAITLENPSCGDVVKLAISDGVHGEAVEIHFDGSGCSISQASASIMAELLSGKTRSEAIAIAEKVLSVFRGEIDPETLEEYGDIQALSGISRLPVRLKCAALAWKGALRILQDAKSD